MRPYGLCSSRIVEDSFERLPSIGISMQVPRKPPFGPCSLFEKVTKIFRRSFSTATPWSYRSSTAYHCRSFSQQSLLSVPIIIFRLRLIQCAHCPGACQNLGVSQSQEESVFLCVSLSVCLSVCEATATKVLTATTASQTAQSVWGAPRIDGIGGAGFNSAPISIQGSHVRPRKQATSCALPPLRTPSLSPSIHLLARQPQS